MDLSNFAISTSTLSGPFDAKLAAIKQAGFGSITLGSKDLIGHPNGIDGALDVLNQSQLRVNSFQLLRDFGGFEGRFLDYKLNLAKTDLQLLGRIGSDLLLVCSATSSNASGDADAIADDLATLAALATPLGIRIGYLPLAWARWTSEYTAAWEIVRRADRANLGLVLDSFHIFARGTDMSQIAALPAEKIFMVHLSDYMWDVMPALDDLIDTARHHRVFPGEGGHGDRVVSMVRTLQKIGYQGDYSFTVFNDDYLQCAPSAILERARRSASWIIESVSSREVQT